MTVVVPVYNKSDYLEQCLASLLQQSLSDIEVICIDDASTDASPKIMETIARKDKRVSVIKNSENIGPGLCRNKGIEMARADFVQFVDADDLLPADALQNLNAAATEDNVDLVKGSVSYFKNDPKRCHSIYFMESKSNFKPMSQEQFWVPWWHGSYLISRKLILGNGIRYPALRKGEDPVFLLLVLLNAEAISTISNVVYLVRESERQPSINDMIDYLEHASMVKELMFKYGENYWKRGYGPKLLEDVIYHINTSLFSAEQTKLLLSKSEKIWGKTAVRKALDADNIS